MSEMLDPDKDEDVEFYSHTKFILNEIQNHLLGAKKNKKQILMALRRYGTIAYVFFKNRGKRDLSNFFEEVSNLYLTK